LIDFAAEAKRSAANVIEAARRESSRRHAIGVIPAVPGKRAALPAYAWSHQPLGRHFDFDSGVLVLKTRRCGVALLLIIPMGFGCAVGRLDPEPGQSDLFDPKYQVPELEMPPLLLPDALPDPDVTR